MSIEQDDMIPVNPNTGRAAPLKVIQDAGIAYDPTTQHLDLSKDEKRRTTALMLAIQAYQHLIIKDAAMYEAIARDDRTRAGGPTIQPATMDAMVDAAIQFDLFISGRLDQAANEIYNAIKEESAQSEEEAQ